MRVPEASRGMAGGAPTTEHRWLPVEVGASSNGYCCTWIALNCAELSVSPEVSKGIRRAFSSSCMEPVDTQASRQRVRQTHAYDSMHMPTHSHARAQGRG